MSSSVVMHAPAMTTPAPSARNGRRRASAISTISPPTRTSEATEIVSSSSDAAAMVRGRSAPRPLERRGVEALTPGGADGQHVHDAEQHHGAGGE